MFLYTVTDKQGTVIEDNTMEATSVIVLDTNKADSVKIIYDNLSGIVKDIVQFLKDT